MNFQDLLSEGFKNDKRFLSSDICVVCRKLKPVLIEMIFKEKQAPSKANMLKAGITEEEIILLKRRKVFGGKDDNIFINWKSNKFYPGCSLFEFAAELNSAEAFREDYRVRLSNLFDNFSDLAKKLGTNWHWVHDRVKERLQVNYNFDLIYSPLVNDEITRLADDIDTISSDYEITDVFVGTTVLEDLNSYVDYFLNNRT